MSNVGSEMYGWARELFPICRSLTGDGVRQTLQYIQSILPELQIHAVPSGTSAFDWTVPPEWNIRDAFVADEAGQRVIDFQAHNLHVVGYSEPVDQWMTMAELDGHLHSLPAQPDAIPYITSYYQRRWGFCLADRQREELKRNPTRRFHVKIDSTLQPGHLCYGELILPGSSDREVLLSTYVCHPSMANNELSGPCVQTAVARWLRDERPDRRLTYRILFVVETIGSIVYLSRHLETLKRNMLAGFVLSCVGDERCYSYLGSRLGHTLADRIAKHVLGHDHPDFLEYSYLDRGSDERQYCFPGVDLPVCTLMRSKFGTFPEYHTSEDDLNLITPAGLQGSFQLVCECLRLAEAIGPYRCTTLCEPQLGKRGLYPSLSTKQTREIVHHMMNLIAYSDGEHDLIDVAERLEIDARELISLADKLVDADVLRPAD